MAGKGRNTAGGKTEAEGGRQGQHKGHSQGGTCSPGVYSLTSLSLSRLFAVTDRSRREEGSWELKEEAKGSRISISGQWLLPDYHNPEQTFTTYSTGCCCPVTDKQGPGRNICDYSTKSRILNGPRRDFILRPDAHVPEMDLLKSSGQFFPGRVDK